MLKSAVTNEYLNYTYIIKPLGTYYSYLIVNSTYAQAGYYYYYIYSYERGVGITKSCGSGSIASFYLLGKLNIVNSNNFILKSLGGDIALRKNNNFYYLKSLPKIIKKLFKIKFNS